MIQKDPIVSVIMPVYNGMPYLPFAVESILAQTFRDFELVIVDDCSVDASREYLSTIVDDRLVVVPLKQNLGVTGALQKGMMKSRGRYIARLDADDIALPHRLHAQFEFLEADQSIGLIGSSLGLIDQNGQFQRNVNLECNDLEIRWRMLFRNPFFHSTVMFRRDLLDKHRVGYSRKYGEDYQLWAELLCHCRARITSDILVYYRRHSQSWTFTRSVEQMEAFKNIAGSLLERYVPGITSLLDIQEFVMWIRGKVRVTQVRKLWLFAKVYIRLVDQFSRLEMPEEETITFRKNKLGILDRRLNKTPISIVKIALMARIKYGW